MPDFAALVLGRLGFQLSDGQVQALEKVVESACKRDRLTPLQYYQILEADASGHSRPWQKLASQLVIRETYFFRDQGAFADLRTEVLPTLLTLRQAARRLDIWSAGCCTGEEPYSLSILLEEMLGPRRTQWDLRIVATDIDADSLAHARAGSYRDWSFRGVPADLKRRYFTRERNAWSLSPEIRATVDFQVFNLLAGPSARAPFDLVLCRNVLVYFSTDHVRAAALTLASSLRPDGFLLVGPSELTHVAGTGLEPRFLPQSMVYQPLKRLPATPGPPPESRSKQSVGVGRRMAPTRGMSTPPGLDALTEEAHLAASQGHRVRARELCRQAIRLFPRASRPYFVLASVAEEEGDLVTARGHLRSLMYLDPLCVGAYIEMAALSARAGDAVQAEGWRHKALKLLEGSSPDAVVEPFGASAAEAMLQLELTLQYGASS